MAAKQIDFPPLQKESPRVAPFMLILSLLCIVIVAIILATDVFEGSWLVRGEWVACARCRGSTSSASSATDARRTD